MRLLYKELAGLIYKRTSNRSTREDISRDEELAEELAEELVKNHMPSGGGIDNGTKLDWDASTPDKLVFVFGFHHMNQNGYYTTWTHHKAILRASLRWGFDLHITGRNKNEIKDYLYDTFYHALTTDVEWDMIRDLPKVKEMRISAKWEWADEKRRGEVGLLGGAGVVVRYCCGGDDYREVRHGGWEAARKFMVELALGSGKTVEKREKGE
jgi:hypothetical protein